MEAARRLRPTVDFLLQTIKSSCPANSIVVVESHSCLTTGAIAYGSDEGERRYATLPNIVSSFLGGDVVSAMADGGSFACQGSQPERPNFFLDAACVRGGWRGLILIADGPTVRVPQRKDEAVRLVDR